MQWFARLLDRIVREEEGQDIIEYVLLLGFISIIAIVAIEATGTNVNAVWEFVSEQVGSIPLG
jgi:Flp pilus assembly pilin Flp